MIHYRPQGNTQADEKGKNKRGMRQEELGMFDCSAEQNHEKERKQNGNKEGKYRSTDDGGKDVSRSSRDDVPAEKEKNDKSEVTWDGRLEWAIRAVPHCSGQRGAGGGGGKRGAGTRRAER